MNNHRLSPISAKPEFISTTSPFSSFDFIEKRYGDFNTLRRLFSIARTHNFKTVSIESIVPLGIVSEENKEIESLFPGYRMGALQRFAFWNEQLISADDISSLTDKNLIGYAIIKHDIIPDKKAKWHIFESVFRKYNHVHNCISGARNYEIKIADSIFNVKGVMYCQQNALNKACAQVALRSLLDGLPGIGILSFRSINEFAGNPETPGGGFGVNQIRNVLQKLNISFRDVDYSTPAYREMRKTHPYRKFVYSGIEGGLGAMLGFHVKKGSSHIIPFFGHTFNKDTWVPDAAQHYFEIGKNIGYISSDNWTSSFVGHDDNFGSDFCVPKLYVAPREVEYVVELLKPATQYSGVQAEAMSLLFLYSLFDKMKDSENIWMRRLAVWSAPKVHQVVLRAVSITRREYTEHLSSITDWENNQESRTLISILKGLPDHLWMIEVSIPHLFPANERKLGEIILDAGKLPAETKTAIDYNLFIMARLPGSCYFVTGFDAEENPEFFEHSSELTSHVPLFKTRN